MQAPFDIAADLDTPVSAYLKLGSLRPRFLLESVEGGERLARYSFLGFGDALEVRMDANALTVNGESRARPVNQQEHLNALRAALSAAPRPVNAAAAIGTPIAVSIASQLGVSPEPFILAVLFGANMSFATPYGYQTNLLILSAGGYKFSDFLRVGIPLTIIMWIGFSLILPTLYDL